MSYTIEQARCDVFGAILRAVEKDMQAEIAAGERLIRERKGAGPVPEVGLGELPAEGVPFAVQATREVLDELRSRAKAAISEPDAGPPACGIPLAEHVPLSDGFTWFDHSVSGCGCAHPSGEYALWTSELHRPAPAAPETERVLLPSGGPPVARTTIPTGRKETDNA